MTNRGPTPDEPVAIFGGTFDPVHYGHLRCADEARRRLGLQNLFLLPAGSPPHRDEPQASPRQRLDMLALARKEFPQLLIDDRETRRSGPSYMVDTLQELRGEFPHRPLMLLVGQDAANQLHSWSRWEQLFELAHIVILTRPAAHTAYQPELAGQIRPRLVADVRQLSDASRGAVLHLEVEPIDISATDIKHIIASGRRPLAMLPEAVLTFIVNNRLYSEDL
ncbi:MAG: nicotinate-nucleotide adenylyltransferase [Lysobacterales bacterium]